MDMRNVDLTPFLRGTVGFDRMMHLLDASSRIDEGANGYPPYNIEKTGEDEYKIVMAVAGFGEDELDLTVRENSLVITAKKATAEDKEAKFLHRGIATRKFLHRGIATRAFERRFELAETVKVTGAKLENGLLYVDLVREIPEAKKPRSIKIAAASPHKVIESQAA
jgi:molecular chaperone IbpA